MFPCSACGVGPCALLLSQACEKAMTTTMPLLSIHTCMHAATAQGHNSQHQVSFCFAPAVLQLQWQAHVVVGVRMMRAGITMRACGEWYSSQGAMQHVVLAATAECSVTAHAVHGCCRVACCKTCVAVCMVPMRTGSPHR